MYEYKSVANVTTSCRKAGIVKTGQFWSLLHARWQVSGLIYKFSSIEIIVKRSAAPDLCTVHTADADARTHTHMIRDDSRLLPTNNNLTDPAANCSGSNSIDSTCCVFVQRVVQQIHKIHNKSNERSLCLRTVQDCCGTVVDSIGTVGSAVWIGHYLEAVFNTNVKPDPWLVLPYSFIFRPLPMPVCFFSVMQMDSNAGKCPKEPVKSVDIAQCATH